MIESFPINSEFSEPSESFEFKEKELREKFAGELKNPYKGSYLKKLERIAGAFVLAGLVTLAAPEKAVLPEKSQDFKEFQMLDYYHYREPFIYLDVLTNLQKKIEEKGGIDISPQLPGEVFKPEKLSDIAGLQVEEKEIPYFSKPEIIFGEDFIKKNPEKAKEYFAKISKTQEATVIITTENSQGSGVIINTEKGKMIITNNHVINDKGGKWIKFRNGIMVEAKVLNVDAKNDIAILKIDLPEDAIEKKEVLKGTNSLGLDMSPALQSGENIAVIGHPFGYPFEVSLAKVKNTEGEFIEEANQKSFVDTKIFSEPDQRFVKLASYDVPSYMGQELGLIAHKGESIWGMSGGPIIKLDEKGEPRLIGITVQRIPDKTKKSSYFTIGVGIHSQLIGDFLEKSGCPAAVSEK